MTRWDGTPIGWSLTALAVMLAPICLAAGWGMWYGANRFGSHGCIPLVTRPYIIVCSCGWYSENAPAATEADSINARMDEWRSHANLERIIGRSSDAVPY